MPSQTSKELWLDWVALWNGDLALADTIIAPDFIAHFVDASGNPSEVQSPEGLKQWIGGVLSAFADARFTTTVGPLADEALMAGRWVFRAIYQGGFPLASPDAVGKPVEYAGIDVLRVEEGKIVEYWLCADIVLLLRQVGLMPA